MQLSLKIKKIIAREFLFLLLTVVLSIGGTYLFKKVSTEKQKSISNIENIIIEFNNNHDLYNLKSFSGIECKKFKLYAVVVRNKQDENIAYEQTPDYNNELDLTYGELLDKVFDLNDSNIVFFYKWLKTKYRLDFSYEEFKDDITIGANADCDEYEFVRSFYLHSKELKESFFYKNEFSFGEILTICFSILFVFRYLIYAILWSVKTIKIKE